MFHSLPVIGFLLVTSFPSPAPTTAELVRSSLHPRPPSLAGRDQFQPATEAGSASSRWETSAESLPCAQIHGISYHSPNSSWTILCDTDFYAQDIFPFILVQSFQGCMKYCEEYNNGHSGEKCAGFVFAPERSHLGNDCYLKSSVANATSASIHLIGATLQATASSLTSISPINPVISSTSAPTSPSSISIVTPPRIPDDPVNTALGSSKGDGQQKQAKGHAPTVTNITYLGTSVNEVASKYVSHPPAKAQQLGSDMLEPGVNVDLITKYALAPDTGTWTSADSSQYELANMSINPRLSRDGGRGGNVNGTNIFVFCDTATFGKDKDPRLGYLNGFVSSSIAIDESMNALKGQSLSLTNSLGQWQDDVGRMRGWVPMTTGEVAFNVAVSGKGYRYAVWPNSSPILLNSSHAIMYAPLVYLEVDMQDQSSPRYTSLGNTLLLISIDPVYGPHADRLQNQFFTENEVNWGSLGGVRAWSSKGQILPGGDIYVLGQVSKGILLGKVAADDFDDRSKFSFWNGESWSNQMPPADSTSTAFMIDQPVMNVDIIYSPAHMTFIMIYQTAEADNIIYYRYLRGKDNSTLSIIPPYQEGGDEKYVENLLTNSWSEQKVLYTIPAPERGYAYAGGIHAGYFGEGDITNGGTTFLFTWTEHTKVDPNEPDSGYAHKSLVVELGFMDE